MCDYTPAEIEAAVENGDGWHNLGHKEKTITLRGASVEIEKVGGKDPAEGGGEDVSIVIKVGDQLFEKVGYYASHYGTDWDGDVTEVKPVERMVTFYEAA